MKHVFNLSPRFKVAIVHKGSSLIYFAMSKCPHESVSFLRHQLENLHLQIISITTQQLIHQLRINPSFDVVTDIYHHEHLLNEQVDTLSRDPYTFTNYFMPLRMHPQTRDQVNEIITKNKPTSKKMLYGLILGERTVVALIKSNSKISVIPSGIQDMFFILFRYLTAP